MFSVGNQARNNSVLMVSVSIAKNTEMYNITDLITEADEVGCLLLFYLRKLFLKMYLYTHVLTRHWELIFNYYVIKWN